jgi:hypothetical protein
LSELIWIEGSTSLPLANISIAPKDLGYGDTMSFDDMKTFILNITEFFVVVKTTKTISNLELNMEKF